MPYRKSKKYSGYSNPKKNTAWKNFSKYIKLRDAIKTTGDVYYVRCITCGKIKPLDRNMHAGHAISGRGNAILFNEELVNAQCYDCNCEHNGQYLMYERIMIEKYGQEKWDFWQLMKNSNVTLTDADYVYVSKTYLKKTKELLASL